MRGLQRVGPHRALQAGGVPPPEGLPGGGEEGRVGASSREGERLERRGGRREGGDDPGNLPEGRRNSEGDGVGREEWKIAGDERGRGGKVRVGVYASGWLKGASRFH